MVERKQESSEMLKGTLDMMILRTLVTGDAHRTYHCQSDRADLGGGARSRARLPLSCIASPGRSWLGIFHWGVSENNRKAKFYRLTATGRKQLTLQTGR
jgi:PadR family transcriptional regulator PadR